jgi:hypothetical protein
MVRNALEYLLKEDILFIQYLLLLPLKLKKLKE